jgi:hypothetical protein
MAGRLVRDISDLSNIIELVSETSGSLGYIQMKKHCKCLYELWKRLYWKGADTDVGFLVQTIDVAIGEITVELDKVTNAVEEIYSLDSTL